MQIILHLLYFALTMGGTMLLVYHFATHDPDAGFGFETKYLVGAFIYSLLATYAMGLLGFSNFGTNVLLLILILVGSAGYVDAQTGQTYLIQVYAIVGISALFFAVELLRGNIAQNTDLTVSEILAMLNIQGAKPFGIVMTTCFILILFGIIGITAKGDAAIFCGLGLTFLILGDGAEVRFFITIFLSFLIFVLENIVGMVKSIVQKQTGVLKKRYPFTMPMAYGAIIALIIAQA